MKYCLILTACLISLASFAQQKGASPLPAPATATVTTRAVVIGISDYQDEQIPDLRFADKDATAFAAWLQSEAGAGLPPSQIRLLTNAQAKVGNMVAAFTWLIDECKPGDRAVIYFSGHGDVENVTMFQDGYLLGYDTPPTTYMAGGLSVYHFKRIIHTLSAKDVQVVTILDACRAGKLAGSEFGGAKATTAALMEQFENEVKILSCQPDEFSQEGEEWGGGRGCFSYHLIDGLYGLADRNTDLQVNLMEIGNYLEEVVPRETAPLSQIPMTAGNPKTRLSLVNGEWLTALKSQKAEQLAMLKSIESKGMEEMVLTSVDTSIQEMYKQFTAAIERGDLMPDTSDRKSADDYYRILIAEPELAQLHGLMSRNFAAALQNEAQEVTNKLLKTDPQVVSDAWSRPFVYDHIPAYLERATEILGEGHFFYKQLKAKQYFFESKTCRRENYPEITPDSLAKMALARLEKALTYDSSAAYVYVDLGFMYWFKLNQLDKAPECAKKALELSPNYVYAHYLAGRALETGQGEGVAHLLKALELDSTFLPVYQELSLYYLAFGVSKKHTYYQEKYIQKVQHLIEARPEEAPVYYRALLGGELYWAGRLEEAAQVLETAAQLSNHEDHVSYFYLTYVYWDMGKYEEALKAIKKLQELNPSPYTYDLMGRLYTVLKRYREAEEVLKKGVLLYASNALAPYQPLGELYHRHLNRFEEAEDAYKKAIQFPVYNTWFDYGQAELSLGELYNETGRREEAAALFQKVIELTNNSFDPVNMYCVGRAYLGLGNLEAIQETIDNALKAAPDNVALYYLVARLYSLARQEQKALEWLERALEGRVLVFLPADSDLDNIRDTEGFKTLLKKYFPFAPSGDQIKD